MLIRWSVWDIPIALQVFSNTISNVTDSTFSLLIDRSGLVLILKEL